VRRKKKLLKEKKELKMSIVQFLGQLVNKENHQCRNLDVEKIKEAEKIPNTVRLEKVQQDFVKFLKKEVGKKYSLIIKADKKRNLKKLHKIRVRKK
jgi:hypothetical protein